MKGSEIIYGLHAVRTLLERFPTRVQALRLGELRMTVIDLFFGGGDELIEQVVGLHAETFAS